MNKKKNVFNVVRSVTEAPPELLSFSLSNAKLAGSRTAAISLPAGYTCPGAKDCLAWVDRETNKLQDGVNAKYRCFAATLEAAFPTYRKSVRRNLDLLKAAKSVENMSELIHLSLPAAYYHRIRVHADGDFFSADYFVAWMEAARRNPELWAWSRGVDCGCHGRFPATIVATKRILRVPELVL